MILLWADLETSGLNPARDSILEVAAAVATLAHPFKLAPLASWVVRPPGAALSGLEPRVREMHNKSGLLDEVRASRLDVSTVERELLAMVPEVAEYEDRPTLAGASVHFDLGFLHAWMPRLASRLSHRVYDVSAVKLFCRSLGMPKLPRAEAHRAAADVEEAVRHAVACARWLADWRGARATLTRLMPYAPVHTLRLRRLTGAPMTDLTDRCPHCGHVREDAPPCWHCKHPESAHAGRESDVGGRACSVCDCGSYMRDATHHGAEAAE